MNFFLPSLWLLIEVGIMIRVIDKGQVIVTGKLGQIIFWPSRCAVVSTYQMWSKKREPVNWGCGHIGTQGSLMHMRSGG